MKARAIAQEAVSWYFKTIDPFNEHEDNVEEFLRGVILSLTSAILNLSDEGDECSSSDLGELKPHEEEKKSTLETSDFLPKRSYTGWSKEDENVFSALGRRTRARMDAFIESVSMAVPSSSEDSVSSKGAVSGAKPVLDRRAFMAGMDPERSVRVFTPVRRQSSLVRKSTSTSMSVKKMPQIAENDLLTMMELYIRSVNRVRNLKRECVVSAEPPRAVKARVLAIVSTLVNNVGCVRVLTPTLTRLISSLTRELLAVEYLDEELVKSIRRLVSEYEHETSFASLTFLSSPEVSAETRLAPMLLKYIKYLQSHWKGLVADCERERMITLTLDEEVRSFFKTVEFQSIGHLLEVCHEYRSHLNAIELPPSIYESDVSSQLKSNEAIRQAILDLQREIITLNGRVLPPVTTRRDLMHLLSQALNSSSLTATAEPPSSRVKSRHHLVKGKEPLETIESDDEEEECDNSIPTSLELKVHNQATPTFKPSTVNLLTRRLLIAAGRTGVVGDAYFFVRDLFGGEDIEVMPSQNLPNHLKAAHAGSIEIVVRLTNITIKCHGSFDIFPKSMVGMCEPLIQIHTTSSETIYLQEKRATDGTDGSVRDDGSTISDDVEKLVVQERKTEKTGWRTLSIRPAFYEKVQVWNTPS